MRVLHVVHTYPPASRGGTETYVEALARCQAAAGHEVRLLAGSDASDFAGDLRREEVDGLAVARVRAPERSLERLEGLDPVARGVLEAEVAAHAPDVVHLHHWHNLATDAVRALRAKGTPVVVTLHDYFATCPFFFRLPDAAHPCAPELEREVCVRCVGRIAGDAPAHVAALLDRRWAHYRAELEAASARLVLSEAQARFLGRFEALAGLDFEVLRLPAPPLPEPDASAPARGSGRLAVVSWGGLERGKGLGVLAEALELLPEAGGVELHHHGPTLDEAFAAELVAGPRATPLTLHGPFVREDLARFARYDLAVFPSLYLETHGYAVDEALGLGLPVVVSDRGAPAERVGTRGRVVPAGDARALAATLSELARDPAALAALRAGRPAVRGATLEEHARLLEGVYLSARP